MRRMPVLHQRKDAGFARRVHARRRFNKSHRLVYRFRQEAVSDTLSSLKERMTDALTDQEPVGRVYRCHHETQSKRTTL